MPRPERKIEMQHSFVSSFLIVEENQKSEPSPLSRKGSDFYYSVRITGLEPARRRHQNLNLARLPIPPHPHIYYLKNRNALIIRLPVLIRK